MVSAFIYQHLDIYTFFEGLAAFVSHLNVLFFEYHVNIILEQLAALGTTDLDTASVISFEDSDTLVNHSIKLFGPTLTYIFIVFLSVLIDDIVFENLRETFEPNPIVYLDETITLKVYRT